MNLSGSFNLQLTFLCQWPPNWVIRIIWRLELSSGWEDHTLTLLNSCNGPEEIEAFGSTLSHSSSQSPVSKQMPDHPETQYCLEIQVILTKDGGTTPPPHTPGKHLWWRICSEMANLASQKWWWQAQVGPSFSMEGDTKEKDLAWVRHEMPWFMLSGAISWVGNQAQLNTNAVSLQEGQQLITQTITEQCIEARGSRCPQSLPTVSPPFSFCNQDESPWGVRLPTAAEWLEVPMCNHQVSYHEKGQALQCSWDHSYRQWDPVATLTPSPSPSPDCRLESDRNSVSASLSVSSRSDRSGGSGHWHHGWCHWEPRGHMKINLPIFKDEDKKDAVTNQSGYWDIMVYHQAGCWDCTLLLYVICSL